MDYVSLLRTVYGHSIKAKLFLVLSVCEKTRFLFLFVAM